MIETVDGVRRFLLDEQYIPYPKQAEFHGSPKKFGFLGGAAGPGKTLCMIIEQMIACNEFSDPVEAKQVHTLLLRRTVPKLKATVVTRFQEKVPKELYRSYNQTTGEVTWLNGATTLFGSMQHENDAYAYQGQWYHIGYDELCEFTFKQWMATSAWNRCPVSPWTRKYGAGNPIGVGAGWVKKLFVDRVACDEMDESQKLNYNPEDYDYFPCTYLDNPIYANDPVFLANLENYPAAIRDALKYGKWGAVGGYFSGAWDEAENVYDPSEASPSPWHRRWISTDWGFEHWAATYWHYMDDAGVVRTYKELCVKHHTPEELAEAIATASLEDGKLPKFESYVLSHDAFASKATATMGGNANSVATRMAAGIRAAGLPEAQPSTRDKLGREMLMYEQLKARVRVGEDAVGQPIEVARWQIANTCQMLIGVIPNAPRDEDDPEKIMEFLGDDPLQGSGYGLYAILGKPKAKPFSVQLAERLAPIQSDTQKHIAHLRFEDQYKQKHKPIARPARWQR